VVYFSCRKSQFHMHGWRLSLPFRLNQLIGLRGPSHTQTDMSADATTKKVQTQDSHPPRGAFNGLSDLHSIPDYCIPLVNSTDSASQHHRQCPPCNIARQCSALSFHTCQRMFFSFPSTLERRKHTTIIIQTIIRAKIYVFLHLRPVGL
jgi:hypothetical protein